MGRRKKNYNWRKLDDSASNSNTGDPQDAEMDDNARKDDMPLEAEGNGQKDPAVSRPSVTSNENSCIGSPGKSVGEKDRNDLTLKLAQLIRNETRENIPETSDEKNVEKTKAAAVCIASGILPVESDTVQAQSKSDTRNAQLSQAYDPVPMSFESPLTAIIFIAAPLVKNHNLAIVGEGKHLGNWKQPQGKFEAIMQIGPNLHIFKGVVPIPLKTGSNFKFVHVDMSDDRIEYEGEGTWDNRKEELLPDSWNFFIFKPRPKSMIAKFLEGFRAYLHKSETKEKIASDFFTIVFDHTLENVLPGTAFAHCSRL